MKKKILSACLIGLVAISTVACQKGATTNNAGTTTAETTTSTTNETTEATETEDYTVISDKFPTYGSNLPDVINVEKQTKLCMRDVTVDGVTAKELSVWDGESLLWTTINEDAYWDPQDGDVKHYADQIGVNRPGSYWLIDTEEGTMLLLATVSIDGDKVYPRYEIAGLLDSATTPLLKHIIDYRAIELFLASDGVCPVEASFSKKDINSYVDSVQKYFANAKLIYATEINTGDAQVDELYSYFINKKDMANDQARLNEIVDAISAKLPVKDNLAIPASNSTKNGLVTGYYEGEFFCKDGFNRPCYMEVRQQANNYKVDLILEKFASIHFEASCVDGVMELNDSSLKLKITFIDNSVKAEIVEAMGDLKNLERIESIIKH